MRGHDEIDFGLKPGSPLDVSTTLCAADRLTKRVYRNGVTEFSGRHARAGAHTLDMPLLFGDEEIWRTALLGLECFCPGWPRRGKSFFAASTSVSVGNVLGA